MAAFPMASISISRDTACEMKNAIILLLAVFFCVEGLGQTTSPKGNQSEAERTVATLLADGGHSPTVGFLDTLVGRLGDGAAVGVIQYLGRRKSTVSEDSTSPDEIRRILYIVRTAFATPRIIEADENRSPNATLVLLKYLSGLSGAGAVKSDLESTINFVEQLKSDSKAPR